MSIDRYAKQAYSAYRHVVLREAVKREFYRRANPTRYRRDQWPEQFRRAFARYSFKESEHPRDADGKFAESESKVSRKPATRKEVATAAQKAGYFPNKFPGRTGDGMRIEVGDGFIKKNPHTGKWDTFSSDEVRSALGLDGGGEEEGNRSFRKTTGTSGGGYRVGQLIRDPDGKLWTVTKTGRPVGFSDGLSTGRSADSGYEHTAHARPATDEEAKAGKIAELRHKLSLPGPSDDRDQPAHDAERKRWDAELRQIEGRPSAEDEASQKAKQDEDRKPTLMADALSQLDIDRDFQVPDADGDMEDARDWSAITRALFKVKGKSFSIAGIKGMSDAELRALLETPKERFARQFAAALRERYKGFRENQHPRGQPDNAGQFSEKPGAKTKAPPAAKRKPSQPAASPRGELPTAGPSKPGARHNITPVTLAWSDPTPPQGKPGRKAGGVTATGETNTSFGDRVEAALDQLGFRSILPEGQRQNPLDREYDHSGWAFEVKAVTTSATEYKAKPKKAEVESKIAYARAKKLKAGMMIVVADVKAKTAKVYWREGIGAFRLTKSPEWHYAGEVTL